MRVDKNMAMIVGGGGWRRRRRMGERERERERESGKVGQKSLDDGQRFGMNLECRFEKIYEPRLLALSTG